MRSNHHRPPLQGPNLAERGAALQAPPSRVVPYEERLRRDERWALSEGSRHFDEDSAVFRAFHRITERLRELGIAYATAGGMALFVHGFRRFTEDVDLLVTREGLNAIHKNLEGLGYVRVFPGSKNLRDTESGVRIEFLVAGQFPGDGKPKPVAFPDPADVAIERDGIRILNLEKLVELKLASAMTSPDRIKDLADVQEVIKLFQLPPEFGARLNPFVQDKFREVHAAVSIRPRRYVRLWRNKFLTLDAKSIDEMAALLRAATAELDAMRADGVVLDPEAGTADDYAYLVTTDPAVARKYDMHEEDEYWDEEKNAGGDDGT